LAPFHRVVWSRSFIVPFHRTSASSRYGPLALRCFAPCRNGRTIAGLFGEQAVANMLLVVACQVALAAVKTADQAQFGRQLTRRFAVLHGELRNGRLDSGGLGQAVAKAQCGQGGIGVIV
jgi:hypothetical protein